MIDYLRLADTIRFYELHGYKLTDVPWIVGREAYYATKPPEAMDFVTLGGYLVASAEQSFLHLMLGGAKLGRSMAITPCFRHEEYDELHHPYFMKIELIDTLDVSDAGLHKMVELAVRSYSRYAQVRVVPMDHGSFDIVEACTGIELGSYGRRTYGGHTWLYGTGLAEPRLTQALIASKERSST
jgi:hypothetical protein